MPQIYPGELTGELVPDPRRQAPVDTNESIAKLPEGKKVTSWAWVGCFKRESSEAAEQWECGAQAAGKCHVAHTVCAQTAHCNV